MTKITEKTTISITLLGMAISSLVGAILWASQVAAKAELALEKADKIEKMAIDLAEIKNDIQWIKRNLNK
jgi:hypothetical protein